MTVKKLLASVFLCILPALLLAACGADGKGTAAQDASRENALSELNRYRFSPVEWTFPEEYAAAPVAPLIGEDGTVSLVLQRETYENHAVTVEALRMRTAVYTFSTEGVLLREEPIPLGENVSVPCGVLAEDSFWFTATSWGKGHATSLCRFDRTTGTLAEEIPFGEIGLPSGEIPRDMAMDAEGSFYLLREDGSSVVSLNRDCGDKVGIRGKTPLSSLFAGADGSVCAASSVGNTVRIQKVNRTEGRFDEIRSLSLHAMDGSAVLTRGDWLYVSAPDGIYRASMTENGEEEKVLDFTASGILTDASRSGYGQFRGCLDGDTLYFSETQTDAYGVRRKLPRLYRKVSEELAESCTAVQIAFSCALDDGARTAFVLFNRAHDDLRIVPLDYGASGNSIREDGGEWQMLTDIANGVISPDLVIDRFGMADSAGFDGSAAKRLAESGLTADLGPYLDRDPEVNRDNLFGCVTRAFSDRDGAVWGITPYFGLRTWIAAPEHLDGYAADGRWTVGEFLDFYESLPAGTEPCLWFTTENCGNGLLSDLASFYDAQSGTARFDSPEFARWLRVMASLPDPEEYGRTSPFASMKGDELTGCLRDGRIRLSSAFLCDYVSQLSLRQVYGTKDFRFVGYPSHLASGAQLESDLVFLLLKDSPVPDAAWELIRFFFLDEEVNEGRTAEEGVSLPALKSEYDRLTEVYASLSLRYYANGGIGVYPDSETPDHSGAAWREEPLDRAFVSRIRAFLDGEGSPLTEQTPDAVTEIVLEELSALRAGHGTVEDCAGKIRSRVSVWLAEKH